MAAVKDELLHLGRTILHAYFEETNLGPLLTHLAPDVIWLGAGQEMLAEGRTAVTAIFEKGQDQLIPCRQSQERTLVRSLGDGLWLVQICSLVETDPSYKMYLQAYQRCAFCFRKNQAGDWEIAYLNHSMAYEAVRENEQKKAYIRAARWQLHSGDFALALKGKAWPQALQAVERAGLGEEAAALLRSTLAEALEDKLYLPFVEHQSLLGPRLVKAVQQPEFADFLQVVQHYSLTPAKGRPLKEEVFSAREKLVIQRVKEGRTNKEIAQELNVAEITIKNS